MPIQQRNAFPYTDEDLSRFRAVQQLAYDAAVHVEGLLQPGMTERDAAAAMAQYLSEQGVTQYFHKPFAWFGDRTAFEGFWTTLHFYPTRRKLEQGMPVILDVAPVVDGYAADIGYACMLGETALHSRMLQDLQPYRELILQGVRAEKTLAAIYREVDALIAEQGYQNRHRAYPQKVLAHRVNRSTPGRLDKLSVGGFGFPSLAFVAKEARAAARGASHHAVLWNGDRMSDVRATPGLWAVEPHLGFHGCGVKWEELLVVTDSDAYWLDDDLPHVRRWSGRAKAA